MFYKSYKYVFVLIFHFSAYAGMSELISAIKHQDIGALKTELKEKSFTFQERQEIFNKADELIQNSNKNAWFSSETKRSCLALACVVGMGISFLFFQDCASLGLIYDKRPGVKVEFLKELASLSLEEKKYYCSNFLGGLASIAVAIWCGYECQTGYYTDRPRYIHNLLMKHFGQRLIHQKNHVKDL